MSFYTMPSQPISDWGLQRLEQCIEGCQELRRHQDTRAVVTKVFNDKAFRTNPKQYLHDWARRDWNKGAFDAEWSARVWLNNRHDCY